MVLLSSVLPYLQEPHKLIDTLIGYEINYIIVDRTPFLLSGNSDRLTIQKVPPYIYEASYPAWFFNKAKFLEHFQKRYQIAAEFTSPDKTNIHSKFIGMTFEKYKEKN